MSRPNFRIIEGDYEPIDFEEFKKDYMNPLMSKSTILSKYDISANIYLKYGNRVFEETGFKRSKGSPIATGRVNIRKSGYGTFRVDKVIKGRKLYCGTYKTFEDARKVRDYLVVHNWSDDAIDYCMSGKLV